jgi:hypothetical protein
MFGAQVSVDCRLSFPTILTKGGQRIFTREGHCEDGEHQESALSAQQKYQPCCEAGAP